MKSLSRVGVGLSVIFGCLLLALFAELYYLLWWKRRRIIIAAASGPSSIEHGRLNPGSSIPNFDPKSFPGFLPQQGGDDGGLPDSDKDLFRFIPQEQDGAEAEGLGAELYKIAGPPRLLFTIAEETKEDLESDDGKSGTAKVKRSLSDYLAAVEGQTPYLTPVTSPSLLTPPITPNGTGAGNHRRPSGGFGTRPGFDPSSFESFRDAEFNKKRCSPPPTFKFLQDAEEKMRRKLMDSDPSQKPNAIAADGKPPSMTLRLAEAGGGTELITINTSK
ncbi:hypothetical protein MLD38_024159 [Melastoma candidum]|uniref:Uncharacterized protein n=1 Tax=Melastoma candidum TaxID=119954 RepID=A0ACB9NSF6_9MYRT|nr:hypothetical protein MLD38_024159 [Melastoma candidum]